MDDTLRSIVQSSEMIVHTGRYAYLQVKDIDPKRDYFMITKDKDEITVVCEEGQIGDQSIIDRTQRFSLIEIKVSKPFIAKGFLALVTKTIADQDQNVLVVSTYSKDYILVREEVKEVTISALESIGFPINVAT